MKDFERRLEKGKRGKELRLNTRRGKREGSWRWGRARKARRMGSPEFERIDSEGKGKITDYIEGSKKTTI